ncbi:MAG: hypothetical protein K2Y29_01175 [Beijerinckiaceae bacterium]|nr:hypothetical protein [Beijerinckiaceae bacterium]
MGIGEAWRNYVAAMDVVKAAIEARRPVSVLHWRTIADVSLAAHLDKIDAWLTRENWSGAWSPR